MSNGTQGKRKALSGELLFVAVFLLFSLFLLWSAPDQVKWFKRTKWASQPSLWSLIGIVGMVGFGAAHFATRARISDLKRDWDEARIWVRSVEYAVWFMAYVWLVPRLGYLPATLIVAPLLTFRVGYRSGQMVGASAAVGFAIVLVFKAFLEVRIPGGAIYEYLPGALRSFMILNF